MSYNYDFWLRIVGHPNFSTLPTNLLDCVVNSYEHTVDDLMRGEGSQISWYSCERDMINLSLNFPQYVFELSAYGEERDDIWLLQAKKGKICRKYAQIIWPEFSAEDFEE